MSCFKQNVIALEENMKTLRALSDKLDIPFSETIAKKTDTEIEFKLTKGTMNTYRLPHNEFFASIITKDCCDVEFPCHTHQEIEYLIVIEGWIEITYIDETTRKYEKKDVAIIPEGVAHRCKTGDNSVILTITVPPAKEM